MSIWIDSDLCERVKILVHKKWHEKKVECYCNKGTWQPSRFIQVSTILQDMDIHYELHSGKVQLHFEGRYRNEEYKPFLLYLRGQVPSYEDIQWRRWQEMHQGLCEINYDINTLEELEEKLTKIINLFDPIIEKFVNENSTIFPNQKGQEFIPNLTYEIKEEFPTKNLNPTINCVGNIPFNKLIIPSYQRPYKWSAKNVNQLINDLITFRNKEQYRLGTLVLHNNEIVDGQQRIITLCLLIMRISS